MGIWFTTEFRGASTENFGFCRKLYMRFEADNQFIVHKITPVSIGEIGSVAYS